VAIRNPCQITTQNIDCERGSHEDSTYPEAPVTMHPSPVRTWIGFACATAIPLEVVLASSHLFPITDEYRRATVSTIEENAAGSTVNCGQNASGTLLRCGLIASMTQPGTETSLKQSGGDVHDCSVPSDATWKTAEAEECGSRAKGCSTAASEEFLEIAKRIHAPLQA